ncbi:cytochrome c maturation protein CcmE [Desulfocurvibacter africanus]|uniref:Cytochrome c-type biogenesis protein CcmE n=1 Tax=Desulfocurvibacter africanus subsp. africanus str. Walvis Bay TaxID=690850 RepID=F3Z3S7_DESAF|nr:cytochrome c maturation protein CcmE [Desulfocurvibacter africanus]EGJ51542.1 cytochrome c-type biogenesis protein CcmE [Desulfocurvibacter africanus subsp. africanus str. Walvis Bay]
MNNAKGGKGIYIAALLLFLGGLGYLLYSGLSGGSVYFLNVSEALAMETGKLSQARLFGTVAADGLHSKDGSLGVVFQLVDKDDASKRIRVDYGGAVPDTFKPGVEVIVEGGLDPQSQVFSASMLMTKCPSKYEKENRG